MGLLVKVCQKLLHITVQIQGRLTAAFNIRSTIISPGAIATELLDGISQPELAAQLRDSIVAYLAPEDVAEAIIYAIAQPATVGINEILLRPTAQQV